MSVVEEDSTDESLELESPEGNLAEPLLPAGAAEDDKCPNGHATDRNTWDNWLAFARGVKNRILARKGMLWGLMSGVATSLEAIFADLADDQSPPLQNTFYRSLVLTSAIFFISWKQNSSYTNNDLIFFLLFGIFEFGSTVFTFLAVEFGNIGDVTSIQANLPIPAAILGCVLFGEVPAAVHIALLILNAAGLFIVSKPPFLFRDGITSPMAFRGDVFAVVSVILTALFQAVARKFAYRDAHDSFLLLAVGGLAGLMGSSVLLTVTNFWTLPTDFNLLIICLTLGVMSCMSLLGAAKGLETESMFTIGILVTISIPLTYFYQIIFVGKMPQWYTFFGALLSIASTTCIYLTSLRADNEDSE